MLASAKAKVLLQIPLRIDQAIERYPWLCGVRNPFRQGDQFSEHRIDQIVSLSKVLKKPNTIYAVYHQVPEQKPGPIEFRGMIKIDPRYWDSNFGAAEIERNVDQMFRDSQSIRMQLTIEHLFLEVRDEKEEIWRCKIILPPEASSGITSQMFSDALSRGVVH